MNFTFDLTFSPIESSPEVHGVAGNTVWSHMACDFP